MQDRTLGIGGEQMAFAGVCVLPVLCQQMVVVLEHTGANRALDLAGQAALAVEALDAGLVDR
ncbi:hypothetical protein ACMGT0_29145 [Pseudomonas sp. RHF3.3-3]|uniref:hypothetical protein n=1 Tax=Pseudomonas sp. RHF3.3-3 TaxID=3396624 RepID=UPI003A88EC67